MSDEQLAEPTDERARLVLDRYMAAFEQSDMTATLTHLTRLSLFAEPTLFNRFGLPPTMPAGHRLATGDSSQ